MKIDNVDDENKKRKNEYWRQDLKDAGIEFREEDIVREIIDGKEHIIILGSVDLAGFLKMLAAEGEKYE